VGLLDGDAEASAAQLPAVGGLKTTSELTPSRPITFVKEPTSKAIPLRYDGLCRVCGVDLAAGAEAICERTSRTVCCMGLDMSATVAPTDVKVVDSGGPLDRRFGTTTRSTSLLGCQQVEWLGRYAVDQ
jgi:hypothetical protein